MVIGGMIFSSSPLRTTSFKWSKESVHARNLTSRSPLTSCAVKELKKVTLLWDIVNTRLSLIIVTPEPSNSKPKDLYYRRFIQVP